MGRRSIAALCFGVSYLAVAAISASASTTTRASVASDGSEADGNSRVPVMSADGRFVAFESDATNLVIGDTNNATDVFVRDRTTGETTRVSVASDGSQISGGAPSISADGRFVAFGSGGRVYLHDRTTHLTEVISLFPDHSSGGGSEPSVSADGQFVAFTSFADLTFNAQATPNIYVRDRQQGMTELVSVATDGSAADRGSEHPSISGDGSIVAFESNSFNLAPTRPGSSNTDLFVRDRATGTTQIIDNAVDGTLGASDGSMEPDVSATGRYVAYTSDSHDLVADDNNGTRDTFIYDRETGTTTRPSVSSGGGEGNRSTLVGTPLSIDGRFVAFASNASNIAPDANAIVQDVFIHDNLNGETELVSLGSDGAQGSLPSHSPTISGDGRFIAFASFNPLVPGDVNGKQDIFVRDRGTQTLFVFSGFDPPVQNLPITNSLKGGSAVPIKWQLVDQDGHFVNDLAVVSSLQYAPASCDSQDTAFENPINADASGQSGLQYDTSSNEFVFVWKTSKTATKVCEVFRITFSDGQQEFARFMLK